MAVNLTRVAELLGDTGIDTHFTSGGSGIVILVARRGDQELQIGPGARISPDGPVTAEHQDLSIIFGDDVAGDATLLWQCTPKADVYVVAGQAARLLAPARARLREESPIVLTATTLREKHRFGTTAVLLTLKEDGWHPSTVLEDGVPAVLTGVEVVKRPQAMQLMTVATDHGQVVPVTGSRRFRAHRLA